VAGHHDITRTTQTPVYINEEIEEKDVKLLTGVDSISCTSGDNFSTDSPLRKLIIPCFRSYAKLHFRIFMYVVKVCREKVMVQSLVVRLSGTASHGLFRSENCQQKNSTMASSGDDSFTGSKSDDNLLGQDDTKGIEVEVIEVEQSQLSRKRLIFQSPGRAVLPTNLRSITLMLNAISKRLHGHDIDANLSLCIVAGTLELQKS
jgi:hypothetical protein